MPLHELQSGEYITTTQELRVAKDEYTARKVQKDRRKARKWITALLDDREVIIFHKEGDEEKMKLGTRKGYDCNFADIPVDIEVWNDTEHEVQNHIMFYEYPSQKPAAIHIDTITKFICRKDGIIDISNSIHWVDD